MLSLNPPTSFQSFFENKVPLPTGYFINFKNYLPSLSGEKHKLFVGKKNVPLSGGIIIVVTFLFIAKFNIEFYHLFLFTIFLIGFFSDLKIIHKLSVLKR